jgi:hypothetical protein
VLNDGIGLARALVGTYEHGRCPRLDSAASRAICPTRGIGPGCGFADAFVNAFCVEALDELAFRFPRATLDVHVDDVAASAYGTPNEVRDRLVEFSHDFHLTLELDMDAEVATDKSAVIASSKRLASAIARRGCGLSQRDCEATVALGAGVTAGKARRHGARGVARTARVVSVKARLKRFGRLARKGKNKALRLFTTGLRPAATYGAEVIGIDNTSLRRLERWVALAFAPSSQGRSLEAALVMAESPTGCTATACAARWANAVWYTAYGPAPHPAQGVTGGHGARDAHVEHRQRASVHRSARTRARWMGLA